MQAAEHRDVVATVDDVEARVLYGDDGVAAAIDLLDRAETAAGAPLVDESERARLADLAAGVIDRAGHWHSVLARRGEQAVGYAGLILPGSDDTDPVAHGDVAVADPVGGDCGAQLPAVLAACDVLGRRHRTRRLQVWLRHATDTALRCAAGAGYCVDRRLGVLVRPLGHVDTVAALDGVTLATFTDADADEVVAVLDAAYRGTADGDWTRDRLDRIRAYDWFDPADLLVARRDGQLAGVHWTKRRGARTGEVYNLAIHPEAQGHRLGAVLLAAGLEHLRGAGCDDVILWVDLANERAVRLYTSQGFAVSWEDVALGRQLTVGQSAAPPRLRSSNGTSL